MPVILVIDDDRVQRLAAVHALTKAGFDVVEAADGIQGLRAARRLTPDAIVCDVVMPGMNGFEMVAALRQEPHIAGTPVLMVTTLSERAQVRQGMTSGADDYLTKPFRFSELCDAVGALLARQETHRREGLLAAQADKELALARERERLSDQYEARLAQELNHQWATAQQTSSEWSDPHATLALVDVVAPWEALAQPDAQALRAAWQQACDALYVFGARRLVRHGHRILATFDGPLALQQAARAALAVTATRPGLARAAVHQGPLGLVRIADPLQLSADTSLAIGPALEDAQRLLDLAAARDWACAVSSGVAGALGSAAVLGEAAAAGGPRGGAPLQARALRSVQAGGGVAA